MTTLDNILDEIMLLDYDDRIILSDILNKRRIEEQRDRIAMLAKESIAEYKAGKYKPQTAAEGIKELHDDMLIDTDE